MGDTEADVQTDVALVQRIGAVPSILDVVCRTTGMGFAAVARVTEGRWIACAVRDDIAFGLAPGGELKVETTICHQIQRTREGVAIDHVADNPVFCDHPTPALYGFQSYISMPILLPDGSFFGTLCAIDPKPNRVSTPEITGMFRLFAELIGFHIDAIKRLEASEANLLGERATSELREQFIAVLGHDLRNPLASIQAGTRLLARGPLDAKASKIVGLIQGSIVRMAGLIDNVMDFARGRLGSGITLDRRAGESIEPALRQVVDELRSIAPDREIETDFAGLTSPVDCDQGRIAQLFSNLLGNALTHGSRHPRSRACGHRPRRLRTVGRQRGQAHHARRHGGAVSCRFRSGRWSRGSKVWGSACSSPPRSRALTAACCPCPPTKAKHGSPCACRSRRNPSA